jgi:hypothetical protein
MERGMYKVSISGAIEPMVDLYLRNSLLDTGERFPTPSNYPNPNDVTNQVFWWTSPDIKVEPQPFYIPDPVFDGAEFDNDLVHSFRLGLSHPLLASLAEIRSEVTPLARFAL